MVVSMKNRSILSLLIIFLFSILLNAQTINHLTAEQKVWLSKANKYEKNGWVYIHIEGTPEERGFQQGYLLAKDIKESIRILGAGWKYQTGINWSWLVKEAGKILTPRVDTENISEIKGIKEGMMAAGDTTSVNELVAYNGYNEFIYNWWPSVKDSLKINSPDPEKESCSSFIATGSMTADGGIVLGHNTMDDYWHPMCNYIIDIAPQKGHHILMQANAGFIHSGTDFFITDAGLVGSETTISGFYPFNPKGVPEFSRMRHATQYANTIDEWCSMMKKGNNGGYANAWLLGDINTNEIARLELGLKYVGFEKKKDGYFVGSNVAENLNILRFETKSNETNIKLSSVARRVRWHQLMNKYAGKINIELAEKFEADHYDTYLKKNQPSCRTLCAHWDLDPQYFGVDNPYEPSGTLDGKVVDSKMARQMSFVARWGAACGTPFYAKKFLEEHPQYSWMKGLLKDRPTEPWTVFKTEKKR